MDRERDDEAPLAPPARTEVAEAPDEPPVAARLVIEIRTDGTRTIARGALEDAVLGERVAIKLEGSTPLALAASLAKAIMQAPFMIRTLVRSPSLARAAGALLPGRKKKREGG